MLLVLKALKVPKVQQVHKDLLAHKVHKATQVLKEHKV